MKSHDLSTAKRYLDSRVLWTFGLDVFGRIISTHFITPHYSCRSFGEHSEHQSIQSGQSLTELRADIEQDGGL